MQQLRLSFGTDRDALQSFLSQSIKKTVVLTITDNQTSMISYRYDKDRVVLRLHRMFLTAGQDVLHEIAAFIMRKKQTTPAINSFIRDNGHQIRRGLRKSTRLRTKGEHHNLREMFGAINAKYFNGKISAHITWGVKGPRRYARTRTLGSYVSCDNVIRINPVLDSKRVPKYFLSFVIYHEMLHADMGIDEEENRRSVHSREFKRREKLFEHFERAMKWQR